MVSMETLPRGDPRGCPEAVFIGRSNVGKSSLVNMVCGRKALAYTSKKPGKTQEFNFFEVDSWSNAWGEGSVSLAARLSSSGGRRRRRGGRRPKRSLPRRGGGGGGGGCAPLSSPPRRSRPSRSDGGRHGRRFSSVSSVSSVAQRCFVRVSRSSAGGVCAVMRRAVVVGASRWCESIRTNPAERRPPSRVELSPSWPS